MSVPKGKRKESQFEVIRHYYRLRKDITDLLLRDFGYSQKKAENRIQRMFGGKPYEELTEEQQVHYKKIESRNEAFENWFIGYQRDAVMDCIRTATEYIFSANSTYPSSMDELIERRRFQNKAIGQCYRLLQELQYSVETLPVDIEKYARFVEGIEKEIYLLKGWRKKDNKFKRALSESASNFANVNNNGNANYNNASNANGVRPDFDASI